MGGARYMRLETVAPLLHHAKGYDPPESPLRLQRCVDDCLWHKGEEFGGAANSVRYVR